MKEKYTVLKRLIGEWLERENENLDEAQRLGGSNTPGAAMAMGAIEAYEQVLRDIAELEQEVGIT